MKLTKLMLLSLFLLTSSRAMATFCQNDPVNGVDPTGLWTWDAASKSFIFDGHLNIYYDWQWSYDDASAGLVLDYKQLEKLVSASAGLSDDAPASLQMGVETTLGELRKLVGFNQIVTGKGGKSAVYKALTVDGHLSFAEAQASEKVIMKRHFKLGELETRIEHWHTREILNRTKDLLADSGLIDAFSMQSDRSAVKAGKRVTKKRYGVEWYLLTAGASVYHGEGCFKWFTETGRELVVSAPDASGSRHVELRPAYRSTYNFYPPSNKSGHTFLDVKPYWYWGNTPDDPTPADARIHPKVHGARKATVGGAKRAWLGTKSGAAWIWDKATPW